MLWFTLVCIMLATSPSMRAQPNLMKVSEGVVFLVVEFADRTPEVGTGFFIDHDGLIVTADHVIKGLSEKTTGPKYDPTARGRFSRITVYSRHLGKKFTFGADQISLVTGQLGNGKALDLAMFRLPLTPEDRNRVAPLHIETEVPEQNETVYSFGPHCPPFNQQGHLDLSKESCLLPFSISTSIGNQTNRAREYVVAGDPTIGFSGGPLVNSRGLVVGVSSWGELIPYSTVITRASYTPARYLLQFFRQNLPVSDFLRLPIACESLKVVSALTTFDWNQVSAPWMIDPESLSSSLAACSCCCDLLGKTVSAVQIPASECAPPFCPIERLFAASKSLALEIEVAVEFGTLESDPNLVQHLEAAYSRLTDLYQTTIREQLPASDMKRPLRAQAYSAYGRTMDLVATEPELRNGGVFAGANDLALEAYARSQTIEERPEVYFAMSQLFERKGAEAAAQASRTLRDYTVLAAKRGAAADSEFRSLNIDPDHLRAVLKQELPPLTAERDTGTVVF